MAGMMTVVGCQVTIAVEWQLVKICLATEAGVLCAKSIEDLCLEGNREKSWEIERSGAVRDQWPSYPGGRSDLREGQ